MSTLPIARPSDWILLKQWIEDTKLFAVIKAYTTGEAGGGGVMPRIIGVDPPLSLSLIPGVIINVAEDLPVEIIMEFYRNSPYYTQEQQDFK